MRMGMTEHTPAPAAVPATAGALTTLGLGAVASVVALRQMNGMDRGIATDLGSFTFFVGFWVAMMAAMMLPGAALAVFRRARVRGLPLFVVAYRAVWTVAGLAAYASYRPHGSLAAGALRSRQVSTSSSRSSVTAADAVASESIRDLRLGSPVSTRASA
jgi:hypothetical protein